MKILRAYNPLDNYYQGIDEYEKAILDLKRKEEKFHKIFKKEEEEQMILFKTINQEFGKKFKELRIKKGLTTMDVAKAVGCSQSQISRLESGERQYSDELLEKICEYFEVDFYTIYNETCIKLGIIKGDK